MTLKQLHTILTKTKRSSIKLISIFHPTKTSSSNPNSPTVMPKSPTTKRQRRKCIENVANYKVVMSENGEYRLVMRDKENVKDLHGDRELDGNVNKVNREGDESNDKRKNKKLLKHKSGGSITKPAFFGSSKSYLVANYHDFISAESPTSTDFSHSLSLQHPESYQNLTYYYSYDDDQEQIPFSQSYSSSNKSKSNNGRELRRHSAGCGTIDFEEFIGSLNIKSEDVEDRLQWLFRFYDQDSDGLITRDEMLQIMYAIYN